MDLVEVNSQRLHLEVRFWTSYELSAHTMYKHRKPLEKRTLTIFAQKYMPPSKIKKTKNQNRTCTIVGVFTLPCKIGLCDTLNVHI